jgi:perosamine synthetase
VAVSSGTAALHAAYAVSRLGPGQELLTTPLTFAATAYTALREGASVRFIDIEDEYLMLDASLLSSEIRPATRAVTTVDYAGLPSDISSIRSAAGIDVTIIQDASHSLGASFGSATVGSEADLTTFSFHPVKGITTAEGGAVAVTRPDLVEPLKAFRNHGLVRERSRLRHQGEGDWHQEIQTPGLNYRLSDVHAALGLSQLRKLGTFVDRRSRLAQRYLESLSDVPGVRLPRVREGSTSAWHLFPIRILEGRRREIFDHLRKNGIKAQVHWYPVHLQPLFEDMGYTKGMCPVAEAAYEELLSIPIFPSLTESEQDHVIERLSAVLS